jgi:predicted small secreted protein
MSRLISLVLLTSTLLVTGCATRTKMAFEDES